MISNNTVLLIYFLLIMVIKIIIIETTVPPCPLRKRINKLRQRPMILWLLLPLAIAYNHFISLDNHFDFKFRPLSWSCSSFFTIPSLYCNFLESFSIWPACAICIDCICIDFCRNMFCHFCNSKGSTTPATSCGWEWRTGADRICLLIESLDRLRRSTPSLRRTILLFRALERRGS